MTDRPSAPHAASNAPVRTSFSKLLDQRPVRMAQWIILACVLFVLVIDGIDIQLLGLVGPVIIAEWGIDRAAFGPALAAALVGMSLGASIGGLIGDRIGRRRALLFATALFGLTTIGAAFTTDVMSMTILRLVSGLGFGAAGPNGLALASEWLPERYRAQAISLLSIGTPAGGMIGATLVAFTLPAHGWEGSFILCGGLTLALCCLMPFFLKESPSYLLSKGRQAEAERAAAQALGEKVTLVPEEVATPGDTSKGGTGILSACNRRLSLGSGTAFFAASVISYAFAAWTTVLLTSVGFTLNEALRASFAFNLAAVGIALAAGYIVRRLGSRLMLQISGGGLLVMIASLAVFIQQISAAPNPAEQLVVVLFIGCIGGLAGAAMASIYAVMAFGYAAACRASGIGFGMMLGRAGGIITSLIGGYLIGPQTGASPLMFFAVLAVNAALIIATAFQIDRHIPSSRARQHAPSVAMSQP